MSRYIDEHRGRFGVEPICRTLDVSASAYYQRATGQRSARAVDDERLLERIREIHAANYYAYGSKTQLNRSPRKSGRLTRPLELVDAHPSCAAAGLEPAANAASTERGGRTRGRSFPRSRSVPPVCPPLPILYRCAPRSSSTDTQPKGQVEAS